MPSRCSRRSSRPTPSCRRIPICCWRSNTIRSMPRRRRIMLFSPPAVLGHLLLPQAMAAPDPAPTRPSPSLRRLATARPHAPTHAAAMVGVVGAASTINLAVPTRRKHPVHQLSASTPGPAWCKPGRCRFGSPAQASSVHVSALHLTRPTSPDRRSLLPTPRLHQHRMSGTTRPSSPLSPRPMFRRPGHRLLSGILTPAHRLTWLPTPVYSLLLSPFSTLHPSS